MSSKTISGTNLVILCKHGQQFHMDFVFLQTSNEDLCKSNLKMDSIVESFDRYKSAKCCRQSITICLVVLDAHKKPQVGIISFFLSKFSHKNGGLIWVDQGSKLERSNKWQTVVRSAQSISMWWNQWDSLSQNRQVECYNETIATITHMLLYGMDLSP